MKLDLSSQISLERVRKRRQQAAALRCVQRAIHLLNRPYGYQKGAEAAGDRVKIEELRLKS